MTTKAEAAKKVCSEHNWEAVEDALKALLEFYKEHEPQAKVTISHVDNAIAEARDAATLDEEYE